MYTITGSTPVAPGGLISRTRTSPTGAGTVIHSSSTGSVLSGLDCASSRIFRASAGALSYKNGGFGEAPRHLLGAGAKGGGGGGVMRKVPPGRVGDGRARPRS